MNKNLNANDFVDMCKANGVNALPIANSYLGLDKVRKIRSSSSDDSSSTL